MSDDILTVEQAAELLHLTPPTVRQMASRNLLPGHKLGGKYWRFSTRQLFAFIRCESIKPEPTSASERRRRGLKNATPPWADMVAICAIYARCRSVSKETGVPHEVDHIVPLQGKRVCGLHVETNLQIIPCRDNRIKSFSHDP